MTFILEDKTTGQRKPTKYPRRDLSPVVGLDENLAYYRLVDIEKPAYNPNYEALKETYNYSEDKDADYPHILLCYKVYEIVQLDSTTIINSLKSNLKTYLNSLVTEDEQTEMLQKTVHYIDFQDRGIGMKPEEATEYSNIKELYNWSARCKEDLKSRITEFLTNGTLPEFDGWEGKPIQL